jgi:glycosyltransferase involved in cell wall biosynthesis
VSPSLSLCMIVKDEQENLEQCLSSVARYVDEVIVCDTGSTDGTKAVAQKYGGIVYDYSPQTHPEGFFVDDAASCSTFTAPPPYSGDVALGDFGGARNESFRHAKGDYVLWVDADDVVLGADKLRDVVKNMAARNEDMAFLAYDYAVDPVTGHCFYRQWRERITKRGVARWANPVHEVMLPNGPVVTGKYGDVTISHRRKADRKSIPNRNYKILLRQLYQFAKTVPAGANVNELVDPRTLFYLGQEARFIEPDRALGFYGDYLKRSGWPEERSAAHSALGQLYEFGVGGGTPAEQWQRALREYAAAHAEMESNPDGIFGMARVSYLQGRWADCIRYCERGFAMGNPDSMLGANPMDRVYRPHAYYSVALANVGRLEEAVKSCKAALAVAPDDPGVPMGAPGMIKAALAAFENQLRLQKEAVAVAPNAQNVVNFAKGEDIDAPPAPNIPKDALVIWAMQLWKQAVKDGDGKRAQCLLDSLSSEIAMDPVVWKMREAQARRFGTSSAREALQSLAEKMKRDVEGKQSIVFWLGPAIEPWTPETPNKTGIGGSETAAIEMAKELHRRGHRVEVIAEADGDYDGVRYTHWQKAQRIDCDVLIVSRQPAIMEHAANINARLKLLWVHDINCGPFTPQMERWLYQFDRVLCLSEWHKRFFLSSYPTLDPGKVVVTRNGIDPERFLSLPEPEHSWTKSLTARSNRLIFSSSPNRGLDVLLYLFPEIRRRVPNVELHIYYGFDCWEAFARAHNNQPELAAIEEYKRRINAAVRDGGVHYHGRVNQRTLADAFMRSKVWAYPTSFTETSCVTAMEAQAAGCVPVCTSVAALPETVKHGVIVDQGDSERFIEEVCRLLKDEGYRRSFADDGRKHALENLSWKGLAGEWEAMFGRVVEELKVRPIPVWREAA